jgi:rubrerythrin
MKRLTTEEFIAKAKSVHGEKYDYQKCNYIDIKTRIVINCNLHGDFIQTPEKHLLGRGCPICGTITQKRTCFEKYGYENPFQATVWKEKIKKTMFQKYGVASPIQNEEIKQKIINTNLQKYGASNPFQNKEIIKKINLKIDKKARADKSKSTLRNRYGVSCAVLLPHAKQKMLENRREVIVEGLFRGDRLNNKVIPLFKEEEYIDVITKYKWKCNTCNTIFEDHLDDGRIPRCNICYPYTTDSQYEYEIIDFIKTFYKDKIVHGNRTLLNRKELDIYIPSKNIAIEFNGLYYHSEICGGKSKMYHFNKTIECDKLGIRLIHIFEDEWRKNSEIVKSKLQSILGYVPHKIYARKCQIREISSLMSNEFLEKNHLQGKDNSLIRTGLFHDDVLVSVMTFGSLRKALGNIAKADHYEMYRFCSGINHNVIGGASKLFQYFINKYSPKCIVSFADRRWSNGNLYKCLGFKKISEGIPNYFYTMDHYKRVHRFNFRKSELSKKLEVFDPSLSEWKNMKNNGYDRIWDCGSFKYEWKLSNVN